MKRFIVVFTLLAIAFSGATAQACTPTGFFRDSINLTAAMINPPGETSGPVNAAGCHIGIYYAGVKASVQEAEVSNAKYFGVVVDGTSSDTSVDVLDSHVHDIGESPFNGAQHGVAVYYIALTPNGTAEGRISGNRVERYQKGGIVANGEGVNAIITDNNVTGLGPVPFIAQNGIQVGFGANASVMRNKTDRNSYTGTSTISTGILVVGGPGYGGAFVTGTQIVKNELDGNDVGIYTANVNADFSAPASATNIKIVNNTITNDALNNNYAGVGYQAGVANIGNNDKIITNKVSGVGYDAAANPGAFVFEIDADPSFTNKPKVHANK